MEKIQELKNKVDSFIQENTGINCEITKNEFQEESIVISKGENTIIISFFNKNKMQQVIEKNKQAAKKAAGLVPVSVFYEPTRIEKKNITSAGFIEVKSNVSCKFNFVSDGTNWKLLTYEGQYGHKCKSYYKYAEEFFRTYEECIVQSTNVIVEREENLSDEKLKSWLESL